MFPLQHTQASDKMAPIVTKALGQTAKRKSKELLQLEEREIIYIWLLILSGN